MPNFNGVNFTVKAFIKREVGHDIQYFEYLHRSAADKKVEYFKGQGCPVILMDKNYTFLEDH